MIITMQLLGFDVISHISRAQESTLKTPHQQKCTQRQCLECYREGNDSAKEMPHGWLCVFHERENTRTRTRAQSAHEVVNRTPSAFWPDVSRARLQAEVDSMRGISYVSPHCGRLVEHIHATLDFARL